MNLFNITNHAITPLSARSLATVHQNSPHLDARSSQWQNLVAKTLVLGFLLAGIAIASSAKAEGDALDYWLLAKYDANGDRTISVEEITRKRERVFGLMDINQDGTVSLDEYQTLDVRKREMVVAARFKKLDLNGDGTLTGGEYTAYAGAFFDIDSDGNGKLSAEEIKQLSKKREQVDEMTDSHKCLWRLCYKVD